MTIAVGLQALDGIVLCSDSQITYPQYSKDSGLKVSYIYPYGRQEKWSVGFTYSGDPQRMDRIYERMQHRLFQADLPILRDYVRECFEESLNEVRQSIVSPSYENIDILCAVATELETPVMLVGKNGVVTESQELAILGIGESSSLIRYLEKLFPEGRTLMDFTTALLAGMYLVQQAIEYVDGVGGEPQVTLFRNGTEPKMFRGEELSNLKGLGKDLDNILKSAVIYSFGVDLSRIDYEKGQSARTDLANKIETLKNRIQRLWTLS
jgi:20S proteasome alpha/beta subunit